MTATSSSFLSITGFSAACVLLLSSALNAQVKQSKTEVEVPPPPAVQADVSKVEFDAIVRIEVEVENRNYRVPWNIGGLGSGVGTGFLIGKNRFLTNAHVVSNRRLIYIKKMDRPEPYKARVLYVAHDCDLALLELEDPTPFKDVKPLSFGSIPKLNTTVIAVGYPIGGERISVTRGVVSRIDFRPYTHSGVDFHLTIQVDAAINPGNSGGPVLQDNKVVGVAFQGYSGSQAQNTAYMIPNPVINRFLKDVEDGQYDYYVDMATQTINLLNPAQRLALGLKNDGKGVMVTVADKAGSAGGSLKTGDVLLSIDGFDIASDGFVTIEGERINLNEIVERKFVGDTVTLKILRNHKEEKVKIGLQRFIPYLIQANHYDKKPNFVLFAGLQFQPLDRELMGSFGISNLKARYIYSYFSRDELYLERPEPIVLTAVLPDSVNTHLQAYTKQIIDTINGQKILTLQDVYNALNSDVHEEGQKEYHVIRLLGEGRPLVMERSKAKDAHKRIMAKYNVGYDHFIEKPLILESKALAKARLQAEKK